MQYAPRNAVPGVDANRGRANGRTVEQNSRGGKERGGGRGSTGLSGASDCTGLANHNLLAGHRPMELGSRLEKKGDLGRSPEWTQGVVGKSERMGRRRTKDGRRKSGGVQQATLHYRFVATTVKDPI